MLSEIIHYMPYGVKRRQAIINYLSSAPEAKIYVNARHCAQLPYDLDIRYLLKKKILKRIRISMVSDRCRKTCVVLAT